MSDYNSKINYREVFHMSIDYGEKNIGIATSDANAKVAAPLSVIRKDKADEYLLKILKIVKDWQVEVIVVGKNEKELKNSTQKNFVKGLKALLKGIRIEVVYFDETLSTKFSNMGLPRSVKKSKGDAYAASYILQSYLDWQIAKTYL